MSVIPDTIAATGTDVVLRVRSLAPRFRERSARTEADRSVPRESVDELIAAGVARLLVPRERGGLDLRIRDLVDVIEAAAQGCASTGWLAGLMAHVGHVVGRFPLAAQEAVWADGPDVVMAGSMGVAATPVPGGYLVTGTSPFASGIDNAEWVYLAGMVPRDGGKPDVRLFLVPRHAYTILDTWDTTGMRGTGSKTVITDGVFVPEEFSVSQVDAREGTTPGALINSHHTFGLPWVATGALVFAAAMLGAAQGAYADVVAAVTAKRTPGGQRAADSEDLQISISLAAARISAARTVLHAVADRADDPTPFSLEDRAVSMRDGTFVALLLVAAIDTLLEVSGTSGFASSSAVQRAWRDIHFAAAHQGLNKRLTGGYYGRLTLHIEDVKPPMFF